MSDVFISYARADESEAKKIGEALRTQGFAVWRDDEIPAHRAYADVISERLASAKAVLVLWSAEAVRSEWVRSEAERARGAKKLVQLSLDGSALPMPFDQIQCASLSGWQDDLAAPGWTKALASIADLAGARSAATAAKTARKLSICVLPFANISDDPRQEYFSDGISEDIITDLSKVSALFVIARNTAFTFKGRSIEIPEIARRLSVSHILEGSVRKAGNRVRIAAQLIDGETGGHLWAERWDRTLDDIFALQDEISEAIVSALKLKLLTEEMKSIANREATSLEAYDRYLRARALANGASTVDEFYRARDACRQALAIDPGLASARGAMVQIYARLETFAPERLAEFRNEQAALADEAMDRSPDHWTSHLLDGTRLTVESQWSGALAALETALALAPRSEVNVRFSLAWCLANVGRVKDAIALLEAARAADPLSSPVSSYLQMFYYIDGRNEASEAEYQRVLDLPGNREIQEHTALFRVWDSGDAEQTKCQFRRYMSTRTLPISGLSEIAEVFDQPQAARVLLRRAYSEPTNQDTTRLAIIGWYAGRFGDLDLSVAALRRSLVEFGSNAKFVLWWPTVRRARRTAAFRQLVRGLGIYDHWRASESWGDFARPRGGDEFEFAR